MIHVPITTLLSKRTRVLVEKSNTRIAYIRENSAEIAKNAKEDPMDNRYKSK